MIDAPSGGALEQAPRWDLTGTEGCGGGIRFLAPYLLVWGYVGIYRRKKYVGGATGGPPLQKKYTSVMIRVCHSRSRFLSCMYIHDDFVTKSR